MAAENNDKSQGYNAMPDGEDMLDMTLEGADIAKSAKKVHDKAQKAENARAQAEAAQQAAQKAAEAAKATAEAAGAVAETAEAAEAVAKTAKNAAEAGEAAAKAGEAAASAGAAASTAGISLIVQLIIDTLKGTGDAMTELITGEDNGFSLGKIIGIVIVSIVFLVYMFTFYITSNSSGEIENFQETEYASDVNEEDSARNKYYKENSGETLETDVNMKQPYLNALTEYKDQTNEAIKTAFMSQAVRIVEALNPDFATKVKRFASWLVGSILGKDDEFEYDEALTFETFYGNPYPYSLKINESEYYSIGDFLKTNGFNGPYYSSGDYDSMPEEAINNDINYIEFNNVMSQGRLYNTYEGQHQNYIDLFKDPVNQTLLYEMTIENPAGDVAPTYYGIYYEERTGTHDDGSTYTYYESIRTPDYSRKDEGKLPECDEKYFYYNIVVKPYGLRELYAIAEREKGGAPYLTGDDEQPGSSVYDNHRGNKEGTIKPILNYEMLDRNELYDRVYLRPNIEESLISEDEFGPAYDEERSELSHLYMVSAPTIDGSGIVTTGRSANYYIPLNKLISIENIEDIVNAKSEAELDKIFENLNITPHEFNGDEKAFLDEIKEMVMKDMKDSGILASLTAAQALLESRHGMSGLTKKGNNLFGMKQFGNGAYVLMWTREEVNGQSIRVQAKFKAYESWEDSIADHSRLLSQSKRYANLVGEKDYKEAARKIKEDGYATDSSYTASLISIIETYKLYEWDTE